MKTARKDPRIEPKIHWWKASSLTITPTLLDVLEDVINKQTNKQKKTI